VLIPVGQRSRCDQQSVDWRLQSHVSTSPSQHVAETVESNRARQSRLSVDTPVHTQSTLWSQRLGRALSLRHTWSKTCMLRKVMMMTMMMTVFHSRRGELLSLTVTTSWPRDQWSVTIITSHHSTISLTAWLNDDLTATRLTRRCRCGLSQPAAAAAAAARAAVSWANGSNYNTAGRAAVVLWYAGRGNAAQLALTVLEDTEDKRRQEKPKRRLLGDIIDYYDHFIFINVDCSRKSRAGSGSNKTDTVARLCTAWHQNNIITKEHSTLI